MLHNAKLVAGDTHFAFAYLKDLEVRINDAISPDEIIKRLNTYIEAVNQSIEDEKSEEMKSRLHILQQEACIMAFTKLAVLRKGADEFNDYEKEQLAKLSFINTDNSKRHFFEYDADHIDRTVSRKFKLGTRWSYLLGTQVEGTSKQSTFWSLFGMGKVSANNMIDPYHADMTFTLLGWAKAGLLDNSKHPKLKSLAEKMQQWELEHPEGLYNEMMTMALDKKNILDFVTEYVLNEGWAPWFKLVNIDRKVDGETKNEMRALISIACREQGMNLVIYNKDENGELTPAHQLNDGSEEEPCLRVLLNTDENKLVILDEISTPSHLYRRLAVRIGADVLQEDPLNTCALNVAGDKGLAFLPQLANRMAKQEVVTKADAHKVKKALGLFVENHKGTCEDDKAAAKKAIAELNYKTRDGLFTAKNAVKVVAVAAFGAGLGFALTKDE